MDDSNCFYLDEFEKSLIISTKQHQPKKQTLSTDRIETEVIHIRPLRSGKRRAFGMKSKHKEFTQHARNLFCFKNVTLSLSSRHESLASLNSYDFKNEVKESVRKDLKKCENIALYRKLEIVPFDFSNELTYTINSLEINSHEYRRGLILIENDEVLEIEDIFVSNGRYYFTCCRCQIIGFVIELNSIQIEKKQNDFTFIEAESESPFESYEKKILKNKTFIIAHDLRVYHTFL